MAPMLAVTDSPYALRLASLGFSSLNVWFISRYAGLLVSEKRLALVGNSLLKNNPRQWAALLFHSFWGVFGWFAVYLPVTVYSWLRRITIGLIPFFLLKLRRDWKKASHVQKKTPHCRHHSHSHHRWGNTRQSHVFSSAGKIPVSHHRSGRLLLYSRIRWINHRTRPQLPESNKRNLVFHSYLRPVNLAQPDQS